MTPVADPGSLQVATTPVMVRQRLDDGEIIILAVRPSGWLVLLMSCPLLVGVAVIGAVSLVGGRWIGYPVDARAILAVCAVVGFFRIVIASMQWLSRLYVLTDRRVMRIKGVFREECYQCSLKKIRQVRISATVAERMVAVASLVFERTDEKSVPDGDWLCLCNPQEIAQAVEEAIRRAK